MPKTALLFALLLGSAPSIVATAGPLIVGECNSCAVPRLRSQAVTVSSLHEQAGEVYLLDADRRSVYRYSVQTQADEAQWSAVVRSLSTATPEADYIRAYWQALDHAPREVVLPEESYGTSTRRAADLLNTAALWNAVHKVEALYREGFLRSPESAAAAAFVNRSIAPDVVLSRPAAVRVRLASGAQFAVRLVPVVNDRGETEFLGEFVANSLAGADGTAIPMTRDGYTGYRYRGGDPRTVADLLGAMQRLDVAVESAAAHDGRVAAITCGAGVAPPRCALETP